MSFVEFDGPNYRDNCYNRARFRRSDATVTVETDREYGVQNPSRSIVVPSRLEVLTAGGWEQHAVIFAHNPDRHEDSHYRVVFLGDGRCYSFWEQGIMADQALAVNAEQLGLTRGCVGTDKPIIDFGD